MSGKSIRIRFSNFKGEIYLSKDGFRPLLHFVTDKKPTDLIGNQVLGKFRFQHLTYSVMIMLHSVEFMCIANPKSLSTELELRILWMMIKKGNLCEDSCLGEELTFSKMELLYSLPVRKMILNRWKKSLENIDCGKGIKLTTNDTSLLFEKPNSSLKLEDIIRIENGVNAIISSLSFIPLSHLGIFLKPTFSPDSRVAFIYYELPRYARTVGIELFQVPIEEVLRFDAKAAFSGLLEKKLDPARYWRTFNIVANNSELFVETSLNIAHICLDSVFYNSTIAFEKSKARNQKFDDFISFMQEHKVEIDPSIRDFLNKPETRTSYLIKEGVEARIKKVFSHLSFESETEKTFLQVAAKSRRNLAHGRLAEINLEINRGNEADFIEWYSVNLNIAIMNYLSGRL